MQTIRTLSFLLVLGATLGGCAVIRGTATTPSGDVWYVRAGYRTAKVRDIYYCPSGELQCQKALIVSREQFEELTKPQPVPTTEKPNP
ncbi:MAG: hypothetical protein B7733_00545 [Myxococcales bacterium FL481]|nr:MAG: hypothetical protein B7733_00545 [Myxococcales bacterium FL481]